MTLEQLFKEDNSIKYAIRWGNNGRKYFIKRNKLTNKQKNYQVEQVCDGYCWLER